MQVMGQVLAWLPATQLIASFYAANPGFCHMILDTAFSLAAAIFSFILLPAGDFLIGQEPPEAVRFFLCPPSLSSRAPASALHS